GDRDCSLQRRHQKLIEIAPAALTGEVRARLAEAAAALLGSAGYAGLATAEFLVQDDEIAFLEVNPRLQVEHTVTEQVTGLDLVEVGLRIADGATLAALALDVTPRGVAVQARVNAETLRPDGTLLPGDGTLNRFQPPAGRGIRVDTAGYPGYTVSPRYDSLLAKVITAGGTLEEAARRAVRALDEFDIAGVPANTALLRAVLRAPGAGAGPGPGARGDRGGGRHGSGRRHPGRAGRVGRRRRRAGADPRGPAGPRPARSGRGARAAPDRAGRGTARGDRAAPRRRTPNGPGEHRRPDRPGQLHRVRRADHRGAAPPPPAGRPHRAHPGRRP